MSCLTATRVDEPIFLDRNERPFGASDSVVRAVAEAACGINRYPDDECDRLRAAIAAHHGLRPEMVMITNGTAEAIDSLILSFGADMPTLLTTRTWPVYAEVVGRAGGRIRWVEMESYWVPADELIGAFRRPFGCAFVCHPHNPSGTALRPEALRALVQAATLGGGLVVFDEAYGEYARAGVPSAISELRRGSDCVVMKTMSKVYGLAGLRVAYVLGPARRVVVLRRNRPRYSVGTAAQAAGLAALADEETVRRARDENERLRAHYTVRLRELGFACPPSDGNFLLVDVGTDSAALVRRMWEGYAIAVADAEQWGFPRHIRVGIGTCAQMDRLCECLIDLAASK